MILLFKSVSRVISKSQWRTTHLFCWYFASLYATDKFSVFSVQNKLPNNNICVYSLETNSVIIHRELLLYHYMKLLHHSFLGVLLYRPNLINMICEIKFYILVIIIIVLLNNCASRCLVETFWALRGVFVTVAFRNCSSRKLQFYKVKFALKNVQP